MNKYKIGMLGLGAKLIHNGRDIWLGPGSFDITTQKSALRQVTCVLLHVN